MKVKGTIQTPVNDSDEEGIVDQSWIDVVTLKGTILPYGNELALKEYGYKEDVKYRFFHKGRRQTALIKGNRFKWKDLLLPIVYVADYGKAQDILLDTSGEGKST